ncbi:MAG: hypothetical protein DWQ31_16990 [Planctomycetota bacterium]|nr:MAG: hypothetical protein DWQ31_16990 [Planctomycetota bacterium]REJ92051.1 MAG: hypothetical protein DWQ35_12940 [Planctomycetota bacterium]REK28587.1 MAG: hypothetical protein DWQ42_04530 [Planctomycetota bacterium]REK39202.1 MAG: hypothetical protein DWQ46_18115 [Planctomycetota bacterium]
MNHVYLSVAVASCYANDNDAYIPELWAQEGLVLLEENMVAAMLVHRDFEDEVAEFGDVVNTRRPGNFKIRRKTDNDDVEQQDATSTNVQVPLDQHFYNSFIIKDGEASKSFQELVTIYMLPAMQVIARSVDRAILGRVHEFLGGPANRVGRLLNLDETNSKNYVLEARKILNDNKAPIQGRRLVLGSASETSLLKNELFISAERRGDGGNALENATLGRILGFDTFMDQNVNDIAAGTSDVATGTVTNALGIGGSGSQAVTITGYEAVVGEFAVVVGNDQPSHITARTAGAGDTTDVTLNEANKFATAAGAAITVYKKQDVQGAYPKGYTKGITIDGFTQPLHIGQLVAFGTGGTRHTYTVIESEASGADRVIYLDRPLEAALADDDPAFPGPAGAFNWAFQRDAIALVSRPLALPNQSLGVMAAGALHNNVAMRVTMQYNSIKQGTVVNMDILAGVAVLDVDQAVVLQG